MAVAAVGVWFHDRGTLLRPLPPHAAMCPPACELWGTAARCGLVWSSRAACRSKGPISGSPVWAGTGPQKPGRQRLDGRKGRVWSPVKEEPEPILFVLYQWAGDGGSHHYTALTSPAYVS